MRTKTCSKCKIEKLVNEFSNNKTTRDGLSCWCRKCQGKYSKEYLQRPKVKQYRREYQEGYQEEYRHRLPKCEICGIQLSAYGIRRCRKHVIFTEKRIENMSMARKREWATGKRKGGWTQSEIAKQKIRNAQIEIWGLDPWNRKKSYRNDRSYIKWMREVKKRDNNICQLRDENCSGYNIVHHIKNWRNHPELRYDINNGITLCQFHHPTKWVDELRFLLIFILKKLIMIQMNKFGQRIQTRT